MALIGEGLKTFFATPEREPVERARALSAQLREAFLLPWFDAIPVSLVIINRHRQILFTNTTFKSLTNGRTSEELIGMRPGEALDCIHARVMDGGCGTSVFCNACGAAKAIVKSLEGVADAADCRMLRFEGQSEVPLDLQVFTHPIEFRGKVLTMLFALDVSHEMRLRYLNRTFHHSLINSAGGVAALTRIMEADAGDMTLFPLLLDSSRRIMGDVLYHRDLTAAEEKRLETTRMGMDLAPILRKMVEDECIARNLAPSVVDLDIDTVHLDCDKRILGHVLRNMLLNALEAQEVEGGQVRVECAASDDGSVSIAMTNRGDIPLKIRKQMFKRYISTKSKDRGLGTYVMKLFTENYLDGTVSFASENGETRFEIHLQ